jgi:hypothetical protein
MDLDLFRVKVFSPHQAELFDPSATLRKCIEERPTSRSRRGNRWYIRNVEAIDETGIYFRFGRTTRAAVSQIDRTTGDFVEAQVDHAPYTHVLVDVHFEIAAIVRRVYVAQRTDSIAKRLAQVLNDSRAACQLGCTFSIGPISNPDALIETLKEAVAIRSFTFSAQRENPFDVNKLFIEPFEKFIQAVGATDANVTVKGQFLHGDLLTEMVDRRQLLGTAPKPEYRRERDSAP